MTIAPVIAEAAELGLALRATLLIGAAWAAAAMLRKAGASAATRHIAWVLGIIALLALPLIWWLAPPLRLPILPAEVVSSATLAPAASAPPPVTAVAPGWSIVLLAAYMIGVALLLLRFVVGRRQVSRLWRDAEPLCAGAWQHLLSCVSKEMGLRGRVELRIARGPAMPMTWGTLAPKILLPAGSHSWPPDRRRLVLLHELAHVARRDSLSRSAASLVCALYWFHPGAWFAARQMRLEQEYAADDRVLMVGAPARNYAHSLLDLARRVGEKSWPSHAAAMAGMCELERRVVSITTPVRRERPGSTFLFAAAMAASLVILAVAAGVPVSPSPALPDSPRMETALPVAGDGPSAGDRRPEPGPRMLDRATAVPITKGGPQHPRNGFDAPRAAAPLVQVTRGEVVGQPVEPAAGGHEAGPSSGAVLASNGQNVPPSTQQSRAYGPRLPQRDAVEQDFDPRIPEPLRQGSSGRGANPGDSAQATRPAQSRAPSVGLQVWPRLVLTTSQALQ